MSFAFCLSCVLLISLLILLNLSASLDFCLLRGINHAIGKKYHITFVYTPPEIDTNLCYNLVMRLVC